MDADVQETADEQTEQGDEDDLQRDHCGAWICPGSGNSFDSRAIVMYPVAGSMMNGVPEESSGTPGSSLAATSACHVTGCPGCRRRKVSTGVWNASIASIASSCASR